MTRSSSILPLRAARAGAFPSSVVPMMAQLSDLPSDPEKYSFEFKWDGVRAICFCEGSRTRLQSRNLLDITASYPELHSIAKAIGKKVILDGEIVALGDDGMPSFARLQNRMHVRNPQPRLLESVPVYYMLFDVLYAAGRSTMPLPLSERREILESLTVKGPSWAISPAVVGEGRSMLQSAQATGMEGVVAKQLDSRYEPGRRSPAWRKIKVIFGQELVIGGWIPQEQLPSHIGSLLMGYYEGQGAQRRLRYAGRLGSGFSQAEHERLVGELSKIRRTTSPFGEAVPRRDVIFVEPRLVAEVEYRRWPEGGMIQQAAYKGLRWDKSATEIVKEQVRDASNDAPKSPPSVLRGRERVGVHSRSIEETPTPALPRSSVRGSKERSSTTSRRRS